MKPLALLILTLLSVTGTASAQTTPAAHRNPFSRAVRYTGQQIKETFTDVRHDPVWAAAVIGTFVLEGIAEGQTVYGRANGFQESNAFYYGHNPSAAKVIGLGTGFTIANLTALHSIRTLFTDSCRREATKPNSRWNSGKIDAASYNPETCKYGGDMLPIIEWAPRIEDIQGNFRVLRSTSVK